MNNTSHILVVSPNEQGQSAKNLTQDVLGQLKGDDTKITVMAPDHSKIEGYNTVSMGKESMSANVHAISRWYRAFMFCCYVLYARIKFGEISSVLLTAQPSHSSPVYWLRNLLKYQVVQIVCQPVSWTPKNGASLVKADRVFYLQSMRESMFEAIACQWRHCPNTTAHQQAQDVIQSERFTPFKLGYVHVDQTVESDSEHSQVYCETQTKNLSHLLDALAHTEQSARPTIQLKQSGANENRNTDLKHQSDHLGCYKIDGSIPWSPGHVYLALPENPDNERQILKALSSGMCVILPADGSFWDLALSNQVNCLKYKPYDTSSLKEKLELIVNAPSSLLQISKAGAHIANGYRADQCYNSIISALTNRSITEQHD
ncbi:hypothetical protein [Vibrio penaeicida]|uniref:hypothetical protein n=1 Tax=Vibrio penaeicida TaxID=104609 RepID=UPI000CE9FA40|nr:hypothetical protein [Vibrio penaeicida]